MKEVKSFKSFIFKMIRKKEILEEIIPESIPVIIPDPVDVELLNEIQYIPGGIDDYLYNYLVIGNILPYVTANTEKRIKTSTEVESRITA